jgi:hypothetical protein
LEVEVKQNQTMADKFYGGLGSIETTEAITGVRGSRNP